MRRRRGQEMVSDAARWRSEAERSRASVIWQPWQRIGWAGYVVSAGRMRCRVCGGLYPMDLRMKNLASV